MTKKLDSTDKNRINEYLASGDVESLNADEQQLTSRIIRAYPNDATDTFIDFRIDDYNNGIAAAANDVISTFSRATVEFPAGNFTIDETISVDDGRYAIVGQGLGTSLTLPDGASHNMFEIGANGHAYGPTFDKMLLDGNHANVTDTTHALRFYDARNTHVQRLYVRDFTGSAYYVKPDPSLSSFVDMHFSSEAIAEGCDGPGYYFEALKADGVDLERVFLGDFYSWANEVGIEINGNLCNDFMLSNPLIKENYKQGLVVRGVTGGLTGFATIQRNNLDNAGYSNVIFTSESGGYGCTNLQLSGRFNPSRSARVSSHVNFDDCHRCLVDGHFGGTTAATGDTRRNAINREVDVGGDPSTDTFWDTRQGFAHRHGLTLWDSSVSPNAGYRATPSGTYEQSI